MSRLNKSPFNKNAKQNSVNPKIASYSSSNPFDSDDELDNTTSLKPPKRTSEPAGDTPNFSANPFDDSGEKQTSSSLQSHSSAARSRYRNDFHDSGGLENQSVQELENYAGEQMTRTHAAAADIDHDLSRSEKLLGSLGGLFSKTWKPKKTSPITGPVITRDDPAFRRGNHLEQRERLGLSSTSKGQSNIRTPPPEPTNALQKVEVEIGKQDDALSDLSNILGELKDMAVDMGTEIDRQTEALGHVQEDVEVLNTRVLDANRRGRRLLGK
ncbi:soluble N-ethylmaleimide-sensitive factor adaptor protein 33 [Actinidia rufa]|uniref:Soluble N-ethylmaleimide-sensitive factor adaptor protein 33 n=1 Tax=Actinidia rufa TaxID=165716 RepID=A0A7J0GA93_9ERIC|nr:soluble N-ethylmaleimide-sensitive factor adaptor protein 33 [Actinidia rufa]